MEQRKQGGGSCPGGGPASWLRCTLAALVSRATERRGARPYCPLSGTFFLLGTSCLLHQLHFLFLHSCLRAGRLRRPKHTKMPTKPNETKPNETKPFQTKAKRCSLGFGAYRVSLKYVLWPTNGVWVKRSGGDRWIGRIPRVPPRCRGRERGRRPSIPVRSRARTVRTNGLRRRPLCSGVPGSVPLLGSLSRSLARSGSQSEPQSSE